MLLGAFLVLLRFGAPSIAQNAPLVVVVDGNTYSVRGTTVAAATGREPITPAIIENARFAARILDEHILHSEANKVRYSAVSRAIVFADANAAHLVDPWMVGAPSQDGSADDLAAEKRRLKEWVATLAKDPRALALSVARMDYIRSVKAYRENAAIYRKVTVRKELLTYDDAVTFFQNQEKVLRMGDARKLEAKLTEEAARAQSASNARDGQRGADGSQRTADNRNAGTGAADAQNGPSQQTPGQPGASNGQGATPGAGQDGSQQNGSQQASPQDGQPGAGNQQAGAPQNSPATDPNSATQQQLQETASQVDQNVQSHSDIEKTADQVRSIAESNADANSALRQYADANASAQNQFQQQGDVYRQGGQTTGDTVASGGGPPPQFSLPIWFGPPPQAGPPRYAAPAPPPRRPPQPVRPGPIPGGNSNNGQSTITGGNNGSGTSNGGSYNVSTGSVPPGRIGGGYRAVSSERATAIIRTYKSIPGGITLEGDISELGSVRTAVFEKAANALILNDDIVYLSPIAPGELADILRAIAANDSMGVSLASTTSIVYGTLPPEGLVAMNLKLADRFLGGITFAQSDRMIGYRFAPGYKAARPKSSNGNLAVYFNVHEFRLEEDPSGEMKRAGARLDITLVPLSDQTGPDGGHIPDYDRIKRGDVPSEYVENAVHLQDNVGYYARERIVRIAFAYGEMAALGRSLKAHGVNLEQLARSIDPGSSYSSDSVPGITPLPPPLPEPPPPAPGAQSAALNPPAANPPAPSRALGPRHQAKPAHTKREQGRRTRERVHAARGGGNPGEGPDIRAMKAQCRSVVRSMAAAGINDGHGMMAAARAFCNR